MNIVGKISKKGTVCVKALKSDGAICFKRVLKQGIQYDTCFDTFTGKAISTIIDDGKNAIVKHYPLKINWIESIINKLFYSKEIIKKSVKNINGKRVMTLPDENLNKPSTFLWKTDNSDANDYYVDMIKTAHGINSDVNYTKGFDYLKKMAKADKG